MGANARRRAAGKAKAAVVPFRPTVTRTLQRLRKKAREIATLQQFEEIIHAAHPDSRGPMRRLLEPLLAPNLPCCGQAMLAQRMGDTSFKHGALCPARNRVTLQ